MTATTKQLFSHCKQIELALRRNSCVCSSISISDHEDGSITYNLIPKSDKIESEIIFIDAQDLRTTYQLTKKSDDLLDIWADVVETIEHPSDLDNFLNVLDN